MNEVGVGVIADHDRREAGLINGRQLRAITQRQRFFADINGRDIVIRTAPSLDNPALQTRIVLLSRDRVVSLAFVKGFKSLRLRILVALLERTFRKSWTEQ